MYLAKGTWVVTEINGHRDKRSSENLIKTVKRFKQQYNTNQMSWEALFKSISLFSLCNFAIYTT